VRRAVDAAPTTADRVLLTGSAWPAGVSTHSGAARVASLKMRPMSLFERGVAPSVSIADLLTGDRPSVSGTADFGLDD